MDEKDNALFIRQNNTTMNDAEEEDVWDDSVLIKAYDKAINLAKEEVSKRLEIQEGHQEKHNKPSTSKEHRKPRKTQRKWCIGSPCRAVYSEDEELYEAVITKIFDNTGTCIVKFIGYGNTEKVELNSLLESEGLQSQIAQSKAAALQEKEETEDSSSPSQAPKSFSGFTKMNTTCGEKMDYDFTETKPSKNLFTPGPTTFSFDPRMEEVMPPAPPLPPHLMSRLPENDADALSSMLMSWYISGFHTGYYHGMKQARNSQDKRKK